LIKDLPLPFTRPIIIIVLLIALAAFSLQRFAGDGTQSVHRSRLLMGTVVEIAARGHDADRLDRAVTEAFNEMERLEGLMSPHRPQSDVARLSRSPAGMEVSPETTEVIGLGLDVTAASGGAFDMTLGRLKALWGIETEAPRVPSASEIREALAGSGPNALRLEGSRVVKTNPDLAVDLGGIAKGYAIDRAIAVLRQAGVESASVNAGGDIRLLGAKGGRPWRIGIRHPRDPEGLTATLILEEAAVVTSGDYERFFEADGVRYHHLFDPRTGTPAALSRSVTVVAKTAILADALSTAAFVLGPEAGLRLLEETPEVEGLIVGADGAAVLTTGLQGRVEWP
jgi:thiamine biosynthesis lipoprotein